MKYILFLGPGLVLAYFASYYILLGDDLTLKSESDYKINQEIGAQLRFQFCHPCLITENINMKVVIKIIN